MGLVEISSISALTRARQLYINEVVLGTAFGVLIGPHVGNLVDPRSWTSDVNFLTREVTRIVLATGLFAIGVELPRSYLAKHAKSLLIMVVPTMAVGWAIVAGMSPPLPQESLNSFSRSCHTRALQGPRLHLLSGYCRLPNPHRSYHLCNNRRQVALRAF